MALTNHEVKHKTIEISTIKNQGENTANIQEEDQCTKQAIMDKAHRKTAMKAKASISPQFLSLYKNIFNDELNQFL